tara:strand:- start:3009 stop:4958 length:1950 start_codon:yes stop_codon:yes gene_type:complete
MVTGYTANALGDQLIASLQDPFQGVIKITDWEIITGLTTPQTMGVVILNVGSPTVLGIGTDFTFLSNGDEIVLGNKIFQVNSVTDSHSLELTTPPQFSTQPTGIEYFLVPNESNKFDYEFRWSQTGGAFSEFSELNKTANIGDLFNLDFNNALPLYVDLKAEITELSGGNSLSLISITYTTQTEDGIIEACPNFCVECLDPFSMDGCANIIVDECEDNLFNPYNLSKSTKFVKQITGLVSNIFGHEVNYFRTEPDMRTEDVTLMEYSLYDVVDNKNIKILVPGNEFPEESITFDIFGMDFADFEIHITQEEFDRAFGERDSQGNLIKSRYPRSKDYMYIPIINRMYEVHTIALADEFNKTNSYWRVMLKKYQERTSVNKNSFNAATDTLTTGIEEVFGERQREEQEKVSNPQQFQTVISTHRDGIRNFYNKDLEIVDFELKNKWTIVSKNYYNLSQVDEGDLCIEYAAKSSLGVGENMAISGWFNPQFATGSGDHFIIGDPTALTGFKTYLNDSEFKVMVNGNTITFNHGINLEKRWYGFTLNISNEFSSTSLSIYNLNESGLPQNSSSQLTEVFNEAKPSGLIWNSNSNFQIRGNSMYMTNIRVFEQIIEDEQRSNILNQYIVRDNQLAKLIDNAIPSIGFQKFRHTR